MGFQAGILGIPVRRPALVETTALGAAGLAGLGAGVWKDASEFLAAGDAPAVFQPSMSAEERGRLLDGWNRALVATRAWASWEGSGTGSATTGT
jgi:glycerol kinase